jgi:uncharacterized phage protein (TIGR01671 family)
MREIKFRAWDKVEGRMAYVESPAFFRYDIEPGPDAQPLEFCGVTITRQSGHSVFRESKQAELMQYTGLKDKMGKDIFEGDIIHCEDEMYSMDTMFRSSDTNPIVFERGAFRYDGVVLAEMITGQHPRICEIIGNIYENPELLIK